ncbi:MAG: hypothetical protein Q8K45_10040 [Rubrivivax sp.]|nr:hypothetical protein [Rubrivivax sp.]
MNRTAVAYLVAAVLPLMGACASVAVTDDAIVTNTSRALGLDKSQFTISDRADSGLQTTFTARTKAGKTYSCYVEGSLSVMGRVVSDALCREMSKGGAPAAPAATPPSDPACNALLRAAGRCK